MRYKFAISLHLDVQYCKKSLYGITIRFKLHLLQQPIICKARLLFSRKEVSHPRHINGYKNFYIFSQWTHGNVDTKKSKMLAKWSKVEKKSWLHFVTLHHKRTLYICHIRVSLYMGTYLPKKIHPHGANFPKENVFTEKEQFFSPQKSTNKSQKFKEYAQKAPKAHTKKSSNNHSKVIKAYIPSWMICVFLCWKLRLMTCVVLP